MDGITIVGEETATIIPEWSLAVYLVGTVILVVIMIIITICTNNFDYSVAVITLLCLWVFVFPLIIRYSFSVRETRQKVFVDSTIDLMDFFNSYNVLDYDGYVFTVVEK